MLCARRAPRHAPRHPVKGPTTACARTGGSFQGLAPAGGPRPGTWCHQIVSEPAAVLCEAMSGIMTRWPVLQAHAVTEHDLDAEGTISDDTVQRWVAAARLAYLDRCAVLRAQEQSGLVLRHRPGALSRGALLGRPTD